jgi:transcriptional regulator with XRE-family HTH domain
VVVVSEEHLSARLQRYREARSITRAELAVAMRALGAWTEGHDIARYEGDYYEPKLRTFAVLAHALGVSMDVPLYGDQQAWLIARECAHR